MYKAPFWYCKCGVKALTGTPMSPIQSSFHISLIQHNRGWHKDGENAVVRFCSWLSGWDPGAQHGPLLPAQTLWGTPSAPSSCSRGMFRDLVVAASPVEIFWIALRVHLQHQTVTAIPCFTLCPCTLITHHFLQMLAHPKLLWSEPVQSPWNAPQCSSDSSLRYLPSLGRRDEPGSSPAASPLHQSATATPAGGVPSHRPMHSWPIQSFRSQNLPQVNHSTPLGALRTEEGRKSPHSPCWTDLQLMDVRWSCVPLVVAM